VCRDRLLADDGWLTKPLAKLILYGLITMLSTVLAYKVVGVDATTGLVLLVVFAVLGLYVFVPIGTECDNLKIPQKSGHALVLLIIVVVLVVSVAWLFICREGLLCVTSVLRTPAGRTGLSLTPTQLVRTTSLKLHDVDRTRTWLNLLSCLS